MVRLTASVGLNGQLFVIFFGVLSTIYYDDTSETDVVLHKEKSISMQLLGSPIPPLSAAALWIRVS